MKRTVELALVTVGAMATIAFGMYSQPDNSKTPAGRRKAGQSPAKEQLTELTSSAKWADDAYCRNRN